MITINGIEKPECAGMTVAQYLEREKYQLTRVAVEKNGAILPKALYAETVLTDGDTIEIVSFVGGG